MLIALTGRRLTVTLIMAVLASVAINPIFITPYVEVLGRVLLVAAILLLTYTFAEQWQAKCLPRWLAQVLAVGALFRERGAQLHAQTLEFALAKEQLERQALDARLGLLQAQIEPHFLFNTLANVQELVETGSPSAGPVFKSLMYFRSDTKYTLVVWQGGEALIRKTIRELADELDPEQFVQVHRSVIVNLRQVSHVHRGANETAELHLKGRPDKLPVSRSFLHLFRQM